MKKRISIFEILILLIVFSNINYKCMAAGEDLIPYQAGPIKEEDIQGYVEDEGFMQPIITQDARDRMENENIAFIKNQIIDKFQWKSNTIKEDFIKISDVIPKAYKVSFMKVMYEYLKNELKNSDYKYVDEQKLTGSVEYLFKYFHTSPERVARHKADIEKALGRSIFSTN
ncbi:MAG: hypothetical protein HZA77_00035 [Candidatus Schekmanbacteria bacterium]|nr:hypothetical protein [Candidatus Schekmanbacteria bacterium]